MNPFRPAPARAAYREIGIETTVTSANPHQLVLLLFDGAIDAVGQARLRMEQRDIPGKGASVSKAIRIISEGLLAALDDKQGGQIAINLRSLYEYMLRRLVEANLKNRPEILSEVISLLNEIRGAWAQIGQRTAPVNSAPMAAPLPERRAISYGAV